MFINLQKTTRAVRFIAVAAVLAASVPASFGVGVDGAAYAQSNGSRGGNGADGGASSPALQCLGADCTNVSMAQVGCTANYCEVIRMQQDRCTVRLCDVSDGRRECRVEVSFDERYCVKLNKL